MSLASTSSSVSASILFTRSTSSAADTTKRWPKGTAWTCPSRIALFKSVRSSRFPRWRFPGGKSQSWQEREAARLLALVPALLRARRDRRLVRAQRYDDPQSRLSDELQTTWNDEWRTYAATFAGIGKAWLREDDAGISYFGRPEGLAMSDQVVAHMRQVLGEHGVTGQWDAKLGFVPRPKRLLDYMLLSALDAHRRQVPMRKCVECSDFFELHRDHGILCSDQCRLARYAEDLDHKGTAAWPPLESSNTARAAARGRWCGPSTTTAASASGRTPRP